MLAAAVCLAWVASPGADAARHREVHVDARRGDDRAGDGSASKPWRTLGVAAARMRAGDTCLVRAGVYRETVRPGDGQTFRACPGERAVVSGCDVVGDWREGAGGVVTAAVARSVRQVFVEDVRLPKARHPDDDGDMHDNADWAPTHAERGRPAGTGSGTVTFRDGLDGRSFDGGFFTGMNGRNPFQANMGRIVRTDGDTLHCDRTNLRWHRSRPGEFDGAGRGYVTDHLNALDAPGEWHWQDGTLHLMPPDAAAFAAARTEARVRLYGFDCSGRKDVTVAGLVFRAASALLDGCEGCVIDRCEFTDVSPWGRHFDRRPNGDPERYTYGNPQDGTAGIYLNGTGNAIRHCRVARGWGALVTVRGTGNAVEDNVIEDANWQCREFAVNVVVNGEGHRVVGNTLRTSTAMLVALIDVDRLPTTATLVRGNDCRDYGHVMLDGGTAAIYHNGNDDLGGAEFSHNLIADNRTDNQRVSCGIYLDDGSCNVRVHHNVFLGGGRTRCGLFTHRGDQRMLVHNNTFWGQTQGAWVSAVWEGRRDAATMAYRNNLSGGPGFVAQGVAGDVTRDHNRTHVPATEFVDAADGDLRLRPTARRSIDRGAQVVGAEPVADGEPDLGAYELGADRPSGVEPPR